MSEIKQCPYCGEDILSTAKKCKHCGEWLVETMVKEMQNGKADCTEKDLTVKSVKPLQIPRGSKFWGWFTGVFLYIAAQFLKGKFHGYGLTLIDGLFDLALFWGFMLFVKYMENFKKEIPLLKFLPWLFLFSAVVTFIPDAEMSDEFGYVLMLLSIGALIFILFIGRQLLKFNEDPAGGIKSLGGFIFISQLSFVVALPFLMMYYAVTEKESMLDIINSLISIALSLVTYILLLKVFSKARRYNKQFFNKAIIEPENDQIEDNIAVTDVIKEDTNVETSIAKETDKNPREGKTSRSIGYIIGAVLGIILVLYIVSSVLDNKKPEYYLCVGKSWTPNEDYSCYLAIVSDLEEDSYASGKEWQGDLTLAVSQGTGSKITPVLSSSEIFHSDKFFEITKLTPKQAFGFIGSFYPASKLANIVYFDCYPSFDYGSEDFSIYGKVDILTKKFTLYTGAFWGLISRGTYADCYLCRRDELMYVFRQSKVEESFDPIVTFKLTDYVKHSDSDLYDSDFQENVIQWLEKQ